VPYRAWFLDTLSSVRAAVLLSSTTRIIIWLRRIQCCTELGASYGGAYYRINDSLIHYSCHITKTNYSNSRRIMIHRDSRELFLKKIQGLRASKNNKCPHFLRSKCSRSNSNSGIKGNRVLIGIKFLLTLLINVHSKILKEYYRESDAFAS
jgi:hypothetical protein